MTSTGAAPVVVIELGGGIVDQTPYVKSDRRRRAQQLRQIGRDPGRREAPPSRSSSTNWSASARSKAAGWSHCRPANGEIITGGQLLGRVVSPYSSRPRGDPDAVQNGIMVMQHLTRNVVEPVTTVSWSATSKARLMTCPRARTASVRSMRRAVKPAMSVSRSGDPDPRRTMDLCRRRRHVALGRAGRDGVYRRRIRVRQVDDGIVAPAASARVAEIAGGEIIIDGEDLLAMDQTAVEDARGAEIAMIFQEPLTALNPVMTIGEQIAEAVRQHGKLGGGDKANRRVLGDAGNWCRCPIPSARAAQYPHELSGGMRAACDDSAGARPASRAIIVADEPTTALDVTVQSQILGLIADLQRQSARRCF